MKSFCQTLATVLVVVETFLFFGGYRLFDFSRSYYGAGAVWAVMIALVLHAFLVQAQKIEKLEQRVRQLEQERTENE